MWVGGQLHAPAALLLGNTRYPLYRRLGGPQGRSGRVRKISSPPEFSPRTVCLVASHYTDCAIPACNNNNNNNNNNIYTNSHLPVTFMDNIGCIFSCLTDKRLPSAPPDPPLTLRPTPPAGKVHSG